MFLSYNYTYKLVVGVELIDDCVPNRVKISGIVVIGNFEWVSASITNGVAAIYSAQAVKWLVNVSEIVDEQSEGIWLSVLLIVLHLGHHGLVDEVILIVGGLSQPVTDTEHCSGDVLGVELELRVLVDWTALVEVGSVNEVPVWLPAATSHLDVVCEGAWLHEGIIKLCHLHHGVLCAAILEKFLSSCKSWRVGLL